MTDNYRGENGYVNYAVLERLIFTGKAPLDVYRRQGQTHASCGWGLTEGGSWSSEQKLAYRAGFFGETDLGILRNKYPVIDISA